MMKPRHLGSIDEAPLAYLRHAFAVPQWEGQSATSQQPDEMADATITMATPTSTAATATDTAASVEALDFA